MGYKTVLFSSVTFAIIDSLIIFTGNRVVKIAQMRKCANYSYSYSDYMVSYSDKANTSKKKPALYAKILSKIVNPGVGLYDSRKTRPEKFHALPG
jgi:hypothetical protein